MRNLFGWPKHDQIIQDPACKASDIGSSHGDDGPEDAADLDHDGDQNRRVGGLDLHLAQCHTRVLVADAHGVDDGVAVDNHLGGRRRQLRVDDGGRQRRRHRAQELGRRLGHVDCVCPLPLDLLQRLHRDRVDGGVDLVLSVVCASVTGGEGGTKNTWDVQLIGHGDARAKVVQLDRESPYLLMTRLELLDVGGVGLCGRLPCLCLFSFPRSAKHPKQAATRETYALP